MNSLHYPVVLTAVLLGAPLFAQNPAAPVAEPPVPADPLELVSTAQPVQDATQRAEILNLLEVAHRRSNVRAQPYDLKTTFTVAGSSASDGMWQMEDVSPSAGMYRWTAQGPNYSAVHLTVNRLFYSSLTPDSLPLRLLQVRDAIFFTGVPVGPRASLRVANSSLNGVELTCVLVTRNAIGTAGAGGRRWDEEEYCMDPKAGTLVTSSLAPGLYVVYDYSKALKFHTKLIADKFTITEAGQTIVEAETESVSDPADNPAAFQPAGLRQIGAGAIMTGPWRFRMRIPLGTSTPDNVKRIVILHGMQSPDGKLSDVELLASSDASLTQVAREFAAKWHGGMTGNEPEPGATPQSHEVLMTLQYVSKLGQ